MKNSSRCPLLLALSFALILISCQQEADVDLSPTPTDTTVDSTELVKEIKLVLYDLNGAVDSITENFTYDTINYRITSKWTMSPANNLPIDSIVYNYNSDHLLKNITYHYATGYTPVTGDWTSVAVDYDNDDVIKKMAFNYVGRPSFIINYTKIITGTGYTLYWENVNDVTDWIYKNTALFNNSDKCTKYQEDLVTVDANGNQIDSVLAYIDSLVYTAAGDLHRVYRFANEIPGPPPPQFVYYELGARHSKGGQLAKQRELLLNGIGHLPYNYMHQDAFGLSVLNMFYDCYSYNQYSTLPCQTSMIELGPGLQQQVAHTASFDSLNRLATFTGSQYVLSSDEYFVWKMKYYKY